jgi:hypothetical protein
MRTTSKPSRRPFDATESSPDFLGPITPPLTELQPFPQFPTVEQMLEHQYGLKKHPLLQLSESPPPSKPASLFQGLLGGNLDVLVQDVLAHPERYEPQTQQMLWELGAGTRALSALSPADQAVLDRATLDFAAYRKPQAPPTAPKPQPPTRRPRLVEAQNELGDGRAPQVEMPGGPMTPYWWLG